MKKLLLPFLILISLSAFSQKYNEVYFKTAYDTMVKKAFVFDFEKLFNKKQIHNLNQLISDFEKETTVEIAVITFDSIYKSDEDFHQNTMSAGNWLGVGKKEANNGVVVGISKVSRKMRIETGDGITNIFSNDEARTIIVEDFTPYYKEGYFY